jgi:hypothetical protein
MYACGIDRNQRTTTLWKNSLIHTNKALIVTKKRLPYVALNAAAPGTSPRTASGQNANAATALVSSERVDSKRKSADQREGQFGVKSPVVQGGNDPADVADAIRTVACANWLPVPSHRRKPQAHFRCLCVIMAHIFTR